MFSAVSFLITASTYVSAPTACAIAMHGVRVMACGVCVASPSEARSASAHAITGLVELVCRREHMVLFSFESG